MTTRVKFVGGPRDGRIEDYGGWSHGRINVPMLCEPQPWDARRLFTYETWAWPNNAGIDQFAVPVGSQMREACVQVAASPGVASGLARLRATDRILSTLSTMGSPILETLTTEETLDPVTGRLAMMRGRCWVIPMDQPPDPGAGWDPVAAQIELARMDRIPYLSMHITDGCSVRWPESGWPCQLCWTVGRWPWEPARCVPAGVDETETYCERHKEMVA